MVTILVTAKQIAGHRLLTRLQPLGHYADPEAYSGKPLETESPEMAATIPGRVARRTVQRALRTRILALAMSSSQ
jgi:hypothetical protein